MEQRKKRDRRWKGRCDTETVQKCHRSVDGKNKKACTVDDGRKVLVFVQEYISTDIHTCTDGSIKVSKKKTC